MFIEQKRVPDFVPEMHTPGRRALPQAWPEEVPFPTAEEIDVAVREGEKELAERMAELEKLIPRWDPDLDHVRITI